MVATGGDMAALVARRRSDQTANLTGTPRRRQRWESRGIECRADISGQELDVIADAQQEKLYVQRFHREAETGAFNASSELAVVAGRDWARTRSADVPVTGPGLPVAGAWLSPATPTVEAD